MHSVKWILNSSELYITQGVFSRNRKTIHIPIVYIDETLVSCGVLGQFLNYVHITVRRTKDTPSEIKETYLVNRRSFSQMLNQDNINDTNKENSEFFFSTPGKSTEEELKHLYLLKDIGEITFAEFEIMKQQLIHPK